MSANLLRTWRKKYGNAASETFGERPGGTGSPSEREPASSNGARHLKKSDGLLRERKKLRYQFISQHSKEWSITIMCEVLKVSRSGFYAWRKRPASERSKFRVELVSEMQRIHPERHKDVNGSPRMHQELLDRGFKICEGTVAKLMQKEGLAASAHRRFRIRTTGSNHGLPVTENTVDREFERAQPNEVWVSDLTYIFRRKRGGFIW